MTREFLGLRMRNVQGIVLIYTQTYRQIFKSALVYLFSMLFVEQLLSNLKDLPLNYEHALFSKLILENLLST